MAEKREEKMRTGLLQKDTQKNYDGKRRVPIVWFKTKRCLPATILIATGVLMWVLSSGRVAGAETYADSAHGNNSYGVNRSGTGYDIGSCAHCHDVYAPDICLTDPNGLMLFASNSDPSSQTDNFCFQCHSGNGTYCYHEAGDGSCTATWTPDLNTAGHYDVYAWWVAGVNRATDAPYTIYYDGGSETIDVDQSQYGGQWVALGTYPFVAGTSGSVVLSDDADGYVIADAIKWEFANPSPSFDVVVDDPSFVCNWTCVDDPTAWSGLQVGGITNNTYSTNFGGGTATFTTIYDAFNPATGDTPSSHNLADVLNHAVTNISFSSATNACLVCHDQHGAQRNFPVTASGLGGVMTAIRRPADYPSPGNPTNLWGDESGGNELMSEYTNKYQAPYYVYVGDPTYEPANDSTSDGSNLPNLKGFCTNNCHGTSGVYSTERDGNLRRIDWSNASYNDEHGKTNDYNGQIGDTKAPYTDQTANYVLACTDCHEPHGSENEWLLRTTVNGTDVSIPGPNKWWYFCSACHKGNESWSKDWPANQHTSPWDADTDCYNNGICHHHEAGGGMF